MAGENKQAETATPPRARNALFPGMLFGAALTGLGTGVSVTGELMPHRTLSSQTAMIWGIIAAVGVLMMGMEAYCKYKSMITSGIDPSEAHDSVRDNLTYCMYIAFIFTAVAGLFTASFLSLPHSSTATGISLSPFLPS